jgi:hypothetical protein
MDRKYIFKSLLLIFMIFIFSSCITIERNIKINEDSSGKETTTVTYGKAFFDFLISSAVSFDSVKGKSMIDSIYSEDVFVNEMKDKYNKISGVKLKDVKAKMNPDSSLTLKVNYTFEKIEKLSSTFQAIEENQGNFGDGKTEISFKKDGKKFNFRYKYKVDEETDSSKSLKNSLSGFFTGQKMIFNITFPYSIKSSNATKTNGKTLTWEFDMDKMMSDMNIIDLKVEMKK